MLASSLGFDRSARGAWEALKTIFKRRLRFEDSLIMLGEERLVLASAASSFGVVFPGRRALFRLGYTISR